LPVSLLVVTADDSTARWAAQPVELGNGSVFRPLALGPAGVPEIVDESQARADPELAVRSAMAHWRDRDVSKAVRIALAAERAGEGLDDKRWGMYFDLVFDSLSEAAQKELRAMDPAKYEYRSEFARRYYGQGRAEGQMKGEAVGRAALLQRQLTRRFGTLPPAAVERLSAAAIDELDAIGERLLSAETLEEALASQ
jgi:hypothetical protein